jgi:glycosyltransferase involved in cell wall biosynthesis
MNFVLLIGPFPDPINGCSYANFILHKNLISKGISCKIINTSTKSISSIQGSSFSISKALRFIKIYFSTYKIFFSKKVYFTPGQTFYGVLKYSPFILLCILLKKPYVLHIHGNFLGTQYDLLDGIKKIFFNYLLSHCSAGIVLSESLRNNFEGIIPKDKIYVVKNFVEDSIFEFAKDKTKTNDKLRILYLSNLMVEKGILYLLDSLLELDALNYDYEATIAGGIEKLIQPIIEEKLFQLKQKVNYIGTVRGYEKSEILISHNVFVLPTFYKMEGQPISLLEAMASGNIIVTTKQGGIQDVVNSDNGYFVEPCSTSSLTKLLMEINNQSLEKKERIQKNNFEYAKNNFTEFGFSENVLSIINLI